MRRLLGAVPALLLTTAALQVLHAAEVTQTITTTASPVKVWTLIGPFDGIAAWLPGAASSPADNGNNTGSVRVITLKAPGNPTVTEKLTGTLAHSYRYEIVKVDPKVLPVQDYTSTIWVTRGPTGTTIHWHGTFEPAGGASEAAATKAVAGLYQAGLANIKTMVEK